jgi:hypothetical protein
VTYPNNSNNVNVSTPVGTTENAATTDETAVPPSPQKIIQNLREKVSDLPPEKHNEVHSVIDEIEAMLEKGPKTLKAVELLITSLVTYFPSAVPWLTAQAQQIARLLGS